MQKIQDMPATGATGGANDASMRDAHHAKLIHPAIKAQDGNDAAIENAGSLLSRLHAQNPQVRRSLFRR